MERRAWRDSTLTGSLRSYSADLAGKLGERLWEIENEFYQVRYSAQLLMLFFLTSGLQLSERNRELDDALKKKDGELRALVERSRRAMDLIEEAKSAEASIRRERDELTHQNQTIQASMRRLRMEWQTEKADLMRQLRDLLQEVEDYRRGGTGGLVSRQTSTSALPEEPDSGSSLPAAEDARSDPPSPASPASPSEARILITGEREDMSPLDLLKNSAKELLRLLAEFDRARLFGTLEASDSEMQSILDVLKEVYMTIGDRSGASADAASKNGTDEPAEEALPQIGSSLLTIFEHGCVGRTEQSEAIESPNVGEETPTTAFVPPDEEFAGSTTKDSSPASSPRGQSRNRMPLVSSGSLIRRDTNTDRDRPRSVLARLASLGNISRRFSVAETTADGTMGTENASMRSDSSGFETTPIDMSQMPNDEALFALTVRYSRMLLNTAKLTGPRLIAMHGGYQDAQVQ